jgi:hypothetical protein
MSVLTSHDEFGGWFFTDYFDAWVALARDEAPDPTVLLDYYAMPLAVALPDGFQLLDTPDAVIAALVEHQRPLRELGYVGTDVPDKQLTVYNRNAPSAQVIWSRHDAGGNEIQRLAAVFHIHRTTEGLRITSIALAPTTADTLAAAWHAGGAHDSAN